MADSLGRRLRVRLTGLGVLVQLSHRGTLKLGILATSPKEGQMSQPQKFPASWNDECVRDLIAHYEKQTEDEQAGGIEATLDGAVVPVE
jgi:hypothetical protein